MATVAARVTREEGFYQKMAVGMAIFILFAFGQFAARGLVDYRQVPLIMHVHAVTMVSWLGLLVVQSTLAQRLDLALHRRLGWLGLILAVVIPPLAIATCVAAVRAHLVPPFFTPAIFLSLVTVESLTFGGLVITAILMRRRTDWHRRFMIGATMILLEPAFGRTLPMPFMGHWGLWVAMVLQLAILGIMARHDVTTRGKIHSATYVVGGLIVMTHVVHTLLGMTPQVIALAGALYG